MTLFWIIIIGLALFFVVKYVKTKGGDQGIKNQIKCPNCQYEGEAKIYTKGSMGIEVILWFFFLFPGLIYSIWRLSSRYKGCPKCGYEHVIKQ